MVAHFVTNHVPDRTSERAFFVKFFSIEIKSREKTLKVFSLRVRSQLKKQRKMKVYFYLCCLVVGLHALHFSNYTFKIMQLTDLHFAHEIDDLLTLPIMEAVLDAEMQESPVGVVIMTGDIISGSEMNNSTEGKRHAQEEWEKMAQPLIDRGLVWAITSFRSSANRSLTPLCFISFRFGNHDDMGPCTREELMTIDQSLTGSLSQFGPSDLPGVSNYWLPIYSSAEETEIAAILYLIASSDGGCEDVPDGDGCVSYNQVDWYKSISREQTGAGKPKFSLMFSHIPLPEYVDVWNNETCYGTRYEDACCPHLNTGLYDAMVEMGDVRAFLCGHDHRNDYCGAFAAHPEVSLCYGRKSGWGYYEPWRMLHGSRVIELTMDPQTLDISYSMWIRNKDGEKEVQELHFPEGSDQTEC
ncbi:metallophosphoesterase family protein [Pelomyxa schiedti]|nr:metallophosphoesterase family protein [Pelomyxa schiedti]